MRLEDIKDQLAIDQKMKVTVVLQRDFGVFVDFGVPGFYGLINITEYPGPEHPAVGSEIDAWVLAVQERYNGMQVKFTLLDPTDRDAEMQRRQARMSQYRITRTIVKAPEN